MCILKYDSFVLIDILCTVVDLQFRSCDVDTSYKRKNQCYDNNFYAFLLKFSTVVSEGEYCVNNDEVALNSHKLLKFTHPQNLIQINLVITWSPLKYFCKIFS